MTKHARISASKIERAYLCPASVSLEEQYPDSSNEAAERGTWIHKIAETILRNEPYPTTIPSKYTQEEVNEIVKEIQFSFIHYWFQNRIIVIQTIL